MMASLPDNMHMLCESLLWPLNVFYAHYGREMPGITPLFPQHVPEPYKQLLVHKRNMTPTLAAYHDSSLFIERLHEFPANRETTREVILRTETEEKPVEYGASRVFLPGLTDKAIALIEEGRVPLGTVLKICDCRHTVEPSGYFKIKPTAFFKEVLGAVPTISLYGRCNRLVALDGTVLAEVCEVLPPLNGDATIRGDK
ncbi:hypothetical protein ACFL6U_10920 [Planctomycetota bacterium]